MHHKFGGSMKSTIYPSGVGSMAKFTFPIEGKVNDVTVEIKLETDHAGVWQVLSCFAY